MNRSEQDQLLQEVLNGEELTPLREASLACGLTFLKRQRRRQKATRVAALAAIPLLIAAALFFNRVSSPASARFVANVVKPPPSAPPAAPESDNAKTLTADELFALLPHHTLALIGKPGDQQLICLDQPVADASRTAPPGH